ncbi:EndoU domain-containing protein [Oculatella sp. LEGE 06141]|uniref:RHS repeat-associated core domain-containing protein n=1 Tax=Oculatella sp. LEGE 06141 TaxID=1828648 RepID=UPI001881D66C|nr:EndoU domain-containing protein [Oculatella sp. LEGE 06141]
MLSTQDAKGQLTQYSYDARGNLKSFSDAANQVTYFEYDKRGNLTRMVDVLNHATTYSYDANGNRLSETRNVTTPTGVQELVTTWSYDKEGQVKTVTDPEQQTTSYEYDANGKQTAVIDALQRRMEYRYDDSGLLIETILPDETPNNSDDNPRTRSSYDAAGRKIATIDQAGRVKHYQYDELGRLVATIYADSTPDTLADNPRTITEYYLTGEVKAQIDERGNRTEYRYDAAGRLIETIYADNTPETLTDNPRSTVQYDEAGRRIADIDALGHQTQFIYDELGRTIETRFHNGTSVSTAYDELDRRQSVTDQNGKVTAYRYDAIGRLTGVKDALGHWTEYTYDELGRLVEVEDANEHETRYEYDKAGRRTAVILPLGQRSSTTYDAVGNVQSVTDFNGETTTYSYDAQNRLVLKDFEDDPDVRYTYTLIGQVESITDGRGITTFTYNERDWLMGRKDPTGAYTSDGYTIEYQYDAAGNRTSVEVPSGTTNYTFNERNWLETVVDPNGGVTRYGYDAIGNLIQTQFPNEITEIRQYNDLNQLEYLETSKLYGEGDKEILTSYTYTLDKAGNRLSVTDHTGRVTEYDYDDLYRLEREKVIVGGVVQTIDFTYDNVGNRLGQIDSTKGTTIYVYDDNDRLLTETFSQINGNTVITTYSHDNNGNTISKEVGDQQTVYVWDDENRLVAVDVSTTTSIKYLKYQYDTSGIRVVSIADGQETRYIVDANQPYAQVLEEYASNDTLLTSYIYGNDLISQTQYDSQTYVDSTTYYHVDALGSTTALTNESGSAVKSYLYDAFGKTISETGATENKYLFAGEQFDRGLGDYYLRQRFYDTDTGRFTRRDTYEGRLAEPLTLHKYLYANANPVMMQDPSGFTAITSGGMGDFATALAIFAILATIGAITYTATLENARNRVCRYEIDEDHIFYPDTRFGGVTGFHSTALALEGYDFEWLDENQIPSSAWGSPYEATFYLPGNPEARKTSSFFPDIMSKDDVIKAIGEAYLKDGCKPNGDWSASIILPGANIPATVSGSVRPIGNIHLITTAYPGVLRQ